MFTERIHDTRRLVKAALRRRLPHRYWALASDVSRTMSRSLATAVALPIALIVRGLPDAVSISLREKLALRRSLHYAGCKLFIRVTSDIERRVRRRLSEKEPETLAWILETMTTDDVLYDIGANVGVYSLVAASRIGPGGTVYAFEPSSRTFSSLVDNVFLNGLEATIVPFECALGNRTGLVDFHYASLDSGAASHPGLLSSDVVAGARVRRIAAYRLDDLVRTFGLRLPTHIKLDVDGSERQVLTGATEVLRSKSLRSVLVEVNQGGPDSRMVSELMSQAGFALREDHDRGDGVTRNWIFFAREYSEPRRPASSVS